VQEITIEEDGVKIKRRSKFGEKESRGQRTLVLQNKAVSSQQTEKKSLSLTLLIFVKTLHDCNMGQLNIS
jgi:hypothetical protein